VTAPHWPHASSLLAYPGLCAARRYPRRAVVFRDREGKEEDEGADVGSVEGLKLAGGGRESVGRGGLSPPGVYF